MPICTEKRFTRLGAKSVDEHFQTSYERSYYYQTPPSWNFYDVWGKKTTRTDTGEKREPIFGHYTSVYKKTYEPKILEDRVETYGRSSVPRKATLKILYEEYKKRPARPINYTTTTGSTYVKDEKAFMPASSLSNAPATDATCAIVATGKDEFPPVLCKDAGYSKHTDPYVSTSQLAHISFDNEYMRRSDKISRKDDEFNKPKCSDFVPQTAPTKGPLAVSRCSAIFPFVYSKKSCLLPHKAYSTSYDSHYDYVLTNLIPWHTNVSFPNVFKLSRNEVYATPSMYRTEQCHVGSGWPIRAAIKLGPVGARRV